MFAGRSPPAWDCAGCCLSCPASSAAGRLHDELGYDHPLRYHVHLEVWQKKTWRFSPTHTGCLSTFIEKECHNPVAVSNFPLSNIAGYGLVSGRLNLSWSWERSEEAAGLAWLKKLCSRRAVATVWIFIKCDQLCAQNGGAKTALFLLSDIEISLV